MSDSNPIPIQVIRRHTYVEADAKQSEATRAWNLAVSLYYKSGRIPWRPTGLPADTCFVGISFHHLKRRAGEIVYASVAQAFSNEIDPFALRGASIPPDQKHDRQPYLTEEQAAVLRLEIQTRRGYSLSPLGLPVDSRKTVVATRFSQNLCPNAPDSVRNAG